MCIRCGQKGSPAFPSCGPIINGWGISHVYRGTVNGMASPKEKRSLTGLTADAQIEVLSLLNPKEQRILSKTCKQFQLLICDIIHNETFLRQVMNLHAIAGAPIISAMQTWQRRSPIRPQPVCLKAFSLPNMHLTEIRMTPDGRTVLSGGFKHLTLLDLQTSASRILDARDNHSLQIISDGSRALSASGNTFSLWDLRTGVAVRTFIGHTDKVQNVRVTPDERRALSSSQDDTLKLWDIETGECLQTFEGHALAVYDVKITPDGRTAVTYSSGPLFLYNTVTLWNLETGEWLRTIDAPGLACRGVTPDGKRLLLGFDNGNLRLLDLETGNCLATFTGHGDAVRCLQITSDGRRAVSGSKDQTVRLWNLETGEAIRIMAGHTNSVYSLQITSDGRIAFSGDMGGILRQWDLETGVCLSALPGNDTQPEARSAGLVPRRTPVIIPQIRDIQISSDGARVLTGTSGGLLKLWEFFPLPEERISAVARISCLSNDAARAAMDSLPQFVQNDLQAIELSLRGIRGLEDEIISARSLNSYNAQLALPDIRASLQRAKSEPIFLTDAIQRVAYLQPDIQNLIYINLGRLKVENGTLQQTGNRLENALLFERGSSIEERIEAINRTIELLN